VYLVGGIVDVCWPGSILVVGWYSTRVAGLGVGQSFEVAQLLWHLPAGLRGTRPAAPKIAGDTIQPNNGEKLFCHDLLVAAKRLKEITVERKCQPENIRLPSI